jgi:hypothetical protein
MNGAVQGAEQSSQPVTSAAVQVEKEGRSKPTADFGLN